MTTHNTSNVIKELKAANERLAALKQRFEETKKRIEQGQGAH